MGPGTSHVGLGFEEIPVCLDCLVSWLVSVELLFFQANLGGRQIVTLSVSIEKKFPYEMIDTSDNVLSLDSKKII